MQVKICCISSVEEAQMAIRHGATALGLVGNMPSGPGIISVELIAEIVKTVPPKIETFLLASEIEAEKIIAHHQKVNTSTIQIVDALKNEDYETIKEALPTIKIVQVIHVIDESSIEDAIRISSKVDAILLDSGNPNLKIKELGGTGRTHNWELSKTIVEKINIPVYLAGGLNPSNVQNAIELVNPYGLDLCSGVRTDGKLDEVKLKAFFDGVK